MTRIEKIRKVAQEREQEKARETMSITMQIASLFARIKELQPRIATLLEIGEELRVNNIPFGETFYWIGFPHYRLETDGTYHHFGFKCEWKSGKRVRLIGLGIEGGGCDGESIYIDANGELVGRFYYSTPKQIISKATAFLEKFDKFEQDVFKYIDNL